MWVSHAGEGTGWMPDLSQDFTTMVDTLRSVLETPADAGRPGQLRLRMEAALGPDEAQRLRRLVHQVVGAAEENLPANLRRIAPLTQESLQRLSGELATSRGWSQEAAQRTTQIWAAALGFEELAASSWPREPAPARPAPVEPTPVAFEATAPPPGMVSPPVAQTPAPAAATPAAPAEWPKPRKHFLPQHATSATGEPAQCVVLAYSGANLLVIAGAVLTLVVVLVTPIIVLGATGILLPIIGTVGAMLLMKRLGRGALVATETGLEFTPYDQSVRKPRLDEVFSAPWSEVTVEPGYVTSYRFAGRRVQVGPRNKAFVAASQRYVGGGAA